MRWIKHNDGKIEKGDGVPGDGDAFFVGENGSMALVNGKLYIDGKQALKGEHKIKLKDGTELPITVDAKGKATKKSPIIPPKGGK